MRRKPQPQIRSRIGPKSAQSAPSQLRIIGGRFGGQLIDYDGDTNTRPMKNRVREAVFNLLGSAVKNRFVVDLFAGTGALSIESISRGAVGALMIDRRFPAAKVMAKNLEKLAISGQGRIVTGDTFIWIDRNEIDRTHPWLVFCSPPYELFVSRHDDMVAMVANLIKRSPPDSLFVVESDDQFSMADLPLADQWDVRRYPPAVVGILETRQD